MKSSHYNVSDARASVQIHDLSLLLCMKKGKERKKREKREKGRREKEKEQMLETSLE